MIWGLWQRLFGYVISVAIPVLIVVICALVGKIMQLSERKGRVPLAVAEIQRLEDMYIDTNNPLWGVYKDEKLDVIRENRRMWELWGGE